MRWLLVVALLAGVVMPGRGDGDWNDDDLPFTFSTASVSGDLVSDSNLPLRIVDPDTGALVLTTATSGDETGLGPGLTRGVQTGVKNGDFSLPPPDITQPISDSNALPYWTWTYTGTTQTATLEADPGFASGYKFKVSDTDTATPGVLSQLVAVPMSQGQQYRVLASVYTGATGGGAGGGFIIVTQFYQSDRVTAIGSSVTTAVPTGAGETKFDAGLVPVTGAYLRIAVTFNMSANTTGTTIGEVRAAFLPAEATVGLASLSASTGGITTTETRVKGITIPANSLVVGSVYKIEAWATMTSTAANVVTIRMRLGPTTLTGTVVEDVNPTATTTASNNSFKIEALLTVRSVGASGTVIGGVSMFGGATQPFAVATRIDQNTGTVTIDTTVSNILELTAQTAAGTTTVTFRQAVISCLMAS